MDVAVVSEEVVLPDAASVPAAVAVSAEVVLDVEDVEDVEDPELPHAVTPAIMVNDSTNANNFFLFITTLPSFSL
ncbi:MAG: hypothetical protein LKE85_00165 [Lachnospiraceae bacterium]|nr:hypothetical protein [Lachnospiraceae bacterium]